MRSFVRKKPYFYYLYFIKGTDIDDFQSFEINEFFIKKNYLE